ncbi:MAG TPA: peptide MFS transporter [Rhizomicrobium sp.]
MTFARAFSSQSRGLYFLFGTEMWERFSYYGMRALLVGYLVKYLLLPGHVESVWLYPQIKAFYEMLAGPLDVQPLSAFIYGTYTGLIYATPILGGWLADRYFGQRYIALSGIVMMAFGHFMMAFENLLFPALALLIVGGGFFKTNTSTQVGMLYGTGDPRRDTGYSIFYVGINVGAFLAPFICGTLGETVGWSYGFGAAGVGMILALMVYLWGWRDLPPEPPRGKQLTAPRKPLTRAEWKSVAALLLLVIPLTLYWACNEQQGNTMALWSIDNTDRAIFGWNIPWTWFQSFNPAVIFFGTPFILAYWDRKGAAAPGSGQKMAYGCYLMMAANLIMAFAAWHAGGTKSSWLWLGVYFTVMTVGEIYLYPISMSLFSKVAPLRIASLMMAVNFLPNFLGGGFLQGWLASYWSRMDKALFFVMIAAIAAVAGLIIHAIDRPLRPLLEEKSRDQET